MEVFPKFDEALNALEHFYNPPPRLIFGCIWPSDVPRSRQQQRRHAVSCYSARYIWIGLLVDPKLTSDGFVYSSLSEKQIL
jgi:hypothetical protein